MAIVVGALVALLLVLAPARGLPSPQDSAGILKIATNPIGIVRVVSGEWFLEGPPRRLLTVGQEFPPNSSVIAGPFAGGATDARAIEFSMYDGSVRTFRCAQPSTCDGPIRLTVRDESVIFLLRDVIRRLFEERARPRPMIVGQTFPPMIRELKDGKVIVDEPLPVAFEAFTGNAAWCALAEKDICITTHAETRRPHLLARAMLTAAPPTETEGVYAFKRTEDTNEPLSVLSYVLALRRPNHQAAQYRYSAIEGLPAFQALTDEEKAVARVLLLEAIFRNYADRAAAASKK